MKKNNKITLLIMMLALAAFFVESCTKAYDNQAYPTSRISGAFLYNGQQVGLLGSGGSTSLNLTQTGPGVYKTANIAFYAKNDGTYSTLMYDGNYTLAAVPGKGPFVTAPTPPTVSFTVNGNTDNVNLNVTPYFWVSNYQTTFVDSVFTATFKLDKIVSTAILEKVSLFLNTTDIVDANSKLVTEQVYTTVAQGVNINGNCTITFNLKTGLTAAQKATVRSVGGLIWANIGVKTTIATDALYQTPVLLK